MNGKKSSATQQELMHSILRFAHTIAQTFALCRFSYMYCYMKFLYKFIYCMYHWQLTSPLWVRIPASHWAIGHVGLCELHLHLASGECQSAKTKISFPVANAGFMSLPWHKSPASSSALQLLLQWSDYQSLACLLLLMQTIRPNDTTHQRTNLEGILR